MSPRRESIEHLSSLRSREPDNPAAVPINARSLGAPARCALGLMGQQLREEMGDRRLLLGEGIQASSLFCCALPLWAVLLPVVVCGFFPGTFSLSLCLHY